MREIKFRAWDKKNKCMIYYNKDCSASDMTLNGVLIDHNNGKNVSTDFELMQFTGLKGKNGKEIYEGDVVKNHWYDCSRKFIGKIWIVKYGMHSIEGLDYYSNLGEGFYFDAISGIENETYNIANLPSDRDKGIEIIGNIYENPKLLEERNGS